MADDDKARVPRQLKTIRLVLPAGLHLRLRVLVAQLGTTARALITDLIRARVDCGGAGSTEKGQ